MAFISKQLYFQVTIMGLNLIVFHAVADPWCGINVHTASLILSTVLGEKWKAISHPFCSGGKKGKVNCLRCICAQPSGHFHLDILLACQTQLTPNWTHSLPFSKTHLSFWALCLGYWHGYPHSSPGRSLWVIFDFSHFLYSISYEFPFFFLWNSSPIQPFSSNNPDPISHSI